jgi:transposase
MTQKSLSMRKISQILRLHHELGLTSRQIGCSCGVARPTVEKYLSRASAAGLGWPLPEGMDEQQLYERLFAAATTGRGGSRPLPDMGYIHRELRRRHVMRQLLWEEYRQAYPEGYGYTQFCAHYNRWKASLDVTLRQQHVAGEKTFLNWAGTTAWWMDRACGHWCPGYLFVGVLGASDYLFATVLADQQLLSWIEAHIRMRRIHARARPGRLADRRHPGIADPWHDLDGRTAHRARRDQPGKRRRDLHGDLRRQGSRPLRQPVRHPGLRRSDPPPALPGHRPGTGPGHRPALGCHLRLGPCEKGGGIGLTRLDFL